MGDAEVVKHLIWTSNKITGETNPAEDGQGWKLPSVHTKQRRPDYQQ